MDTFSTRQLAGALGVSESSIRRWVDRGAIRSTRTEGGHRRIALADAVEFARSSGLDWAAPETLGLAALPSPVTDVPQAVDAALREGDEARAQSIVVREFLAGRSVADLCDTVLQPALAAIGELWLDGVEGILVEHRATTICTALLHKLQTLLPASGTVRAVGGAVAGDPYTLPSLMASAVLHAQGLTTTDLGANTPTVVFGQAVEQHDPALVWVSVSQVAERERLAGELGELLERLSDEGRAVVLGGRGLSALELPRRAGIHVASTMSELAALALGLRLGRERDPEAEGA